MAATFRYAQSAVTKCPRIEALEPRQLLSGAAAPLAPPVGSSKLSGQIIGTSGSYRNEGNTNLNALDGKISTFYDAATGSDAWVGEDFGSLQMITQIQYVPRSGFASRMFGGVFQASKAADFSTSVVNLLQVSSAPAGNVYTARAVSNSNGFRYVRYFSPTNGGCNVAELEFDGKPGGGTVPVVPPNAFPTTIRWKTGASSPIVRAEAVGGMVNGILYVFGGFNNKGSATTHIPLQNECDSYNPATNKWTRLKSFPEAFTHSQGVIVGTRIWFIGGYVGNHPGPGTTHVWIYDTANDSWSRGPDLPQARGAGAAALVGNSIYFSGGMDRNRKNDEKSTYALEVTNTSEGWVEKADLPNGRNHVAGASLGGYFYVIGGQHGQEDGQAAQNEVDRYDPATNTWKKMASLPSHAGKSHVTEGTLVYDGRIIVVGGETGYDNPQKYIVDYDPTANQWNQLGQLPAARSTVVAGIVNGKLAVTTGNGPAATATTWIGALS